MVSTAVSTKKASEKEVIEVLTLSCACVVTRRDNTDFTDAIKKGCLACARVPLHFLGHESHSMQQQGLELMRLSLANIELVKKIIPFSTVFSTIFDP